MLNRFFSVTTCSFSDIEAQTLNVTEQISYTKLKKQEGFWLIFVKKALIELKYLFLEENSCSKFINIPKLKLLDLSKTQEVRKKLPENDYKLLFDCSLPIK